MSTITTRRRCLKFEPLLQLAKPQFLGYEYPARVAVVRINDIPQLGLYASRNVKEGETVAEYGGRVIYKNDLPSSDHLNYCVALNAGKPSPLLVDHFKDEDAQSHQTMSDKMFGRYINSPKGREGKKENVKIVFEYYRTDNFGTIQQKCSNESDALFVRVKFVAKHDIEKDEEFLVNYGSGYPF